MLSYIYLVGNMAHGSKQPHPLARILRSHITQVILVIMIVLAGNQVWQQYATTKEVTAQRIALEEDHEQLIQQREILRQRVDQMLDDFGIEAEIRRNFDVAQEGERVVIIIDDHSPKPPTTPPEIESQHSQPWWQFWQ